MTFRLCALKEESQLGEELIAVSRLNIKIGPRTICLIVAQVVFCHGVNDGNRGEVLNVLCDSCTLRIGG